MDKDWFKEIIDSWAPINNWKKEDLTTACTILADISILNGGEVIKDVPISQELLKAHANAKAQDAIQRYINGHAWDGNIHTPYRFYKKGKKQNGGKLLPFLTLKELLPKFDLNRATFEELEDLPGIGPVTAKRIIEYRETVGQFKELEEVRKVRGISKEDLEQFQDMVYIKESFKIYTPSYNILQTFCKDPNFQNYLSLRSEPNMSVEKVIIRILTEIRYDLGINKYGPLNLLPQTRASSVMENEAEKERMNEIEKAFMASEAYGRLIFDRQYEPFMNELLSHCKKSLRIMMFFFRFEDEASYPTDPLVQKMIEAKAKGADVKVILDRDEATDPYDSHEINSNIAKYFKSNNIDYVFDEPDIVTHSKYIVMDSRHVVVGSHNWTAGSFYQYDDTSIYIDSEELAKEYEEDFDMLWEEYQKVERKSKKTNAKPCGC